MLIKTRTENRSAMARAIAQMLGLEAQYQGPPSFAYQVGDLLVTRDGSIHSNNESLLASVRPFLRERGWIEEDVELFLVVLPTTGMKGRQLTNIVNMVHSKRYRQQGHARLFSIGADFIQALSAAPQSATDFLALYRKLPEEACRTSHEIELLLSFPHRRTQIA